MTTDRYTLENVTYSAAIFARDFMIFYEGGIRPKHAVMFVHAHKHGWTCGRVADGKEGGAITAPRAVTRGRALLVVDYKHNCTAGQRLHV
jgi:hypothetical protein